MKTKYMWLIVWFVSYCAITLLGIWRGHEFGTYLLIYIHWLSLSVSRAYWEITLYAAPVR